VPLNSPYERDYRCCSALSIAIQPPLPPEWIAAKQTLNLGRPKMSAGPNPRQEQAPASPNSKTIAQSVRSYRQTHPHWAHFSICGWVSTSGRAGECGRSCSSCCPLDVNLCRGKSDCMSSCNHPLSFVICANEAGPCRTSTKYSLSLPDA
jgi:hypothetical protein